MLLLNNNFNFDFLLFYLLVLFLRRYNLEENSDIKRVLKEFDLVDFYEIMRIVVFVVVVEGDLISFDDENGEVKELVKKRIKRISRFKILIILSGGEEEGTNDMDYFEILRGMVEESNVFYNKGNEFNMFFFL